MPSLFEGVLGGSEQVAANAAGVQQVSGAEDITIVRYQQQILPLDGSVFWLRGGSFTVKGSLHYATDIRQEEDQTFAVNRVTLTTADQINQLNAIWPTVLLVAEMPAPPNSGEVPLRVAFNAQQGRYTAAGLWHYTGEALYPALATQLIESGANLPVNTLIVSNSLPAWLALINYAPVWLLTGNPGIPLYPSFAVPQNAVPPYGSVHIEPAGTDAIQAFPGLVTDPRTGGTTVSQLMRDRVRVTLYGAQNDGGINFLRLVEQYSIDTETIGVTNLPAIRDGKRRQTEFNALAQQKMIDFEVSYNQARIVDVARQLIESALLTFTPAL